jgi:hypothetical protein
VRSGCPSSSSFVSITRSEKRKRGKENRLSRLPCRSEALPRIARPSQRRRTRYAVVLRPSCKSFGPKYFDAFEDATSKTTFAPSSRSLTAVLLACSETSRSKMEGPCAFYRRNSSPVLALTSSAVPNTATPPRRLPRRGQLHQRTSSKVTLTVTPSTPPGQTRMNGTAPQYRLVPTSPDAPRIAPPLFRKPSSTSVSRPGGGREGGIWTTRRIVVFGCVVVGLVLLVGRSRNGGYSPSWMNRAEGEESDTYGRAQAGREDAVREGGKAGIDEHGRPAKAVGGPGHSWHPAPEGGRPFGGVGRPNSPSMGHDRLIKVGRPAGKGVAAVELAAEAKEAVLPAHDLEVTSATDPEAAQKFLLVGWMGEQVRLPPFFPLPPFLTPSSPALSSFLLLSL